MKQAPHYLRAYLVNDDVEEAAQYKELIESTYKQADVRVYDSIAAAITGLYSPDILLIDVSVVAPMMMSDVSNAYRPIAWYSKQYPACTIIIKSAMGRVSTMDVVNEVNNVTAHEGDGYKAVYGGHGDWDTVKQAIDKVVKDKEITA